MSGDSKQIKFSFVVDENSARAVNRVLDELIKKAQTLAQSLAGGGGGGSGLLGGGTIGGKAPSSASTLGRSGGTAKNTSFAQILSGSTDVFKKIGQESASTMKVMTDALNRGIREQETGIHRLQGSLENLVKTYERVGGASSGAVGQKIQSKVLEIQDKIDQRQNQLGRLRGMHPGEGLRGELLPEIPWPDDGKKGLWSRFSTRMTSNIGGSDPGGQASLKDIIGGTEIGKFVKEVGMGRIGLGAVGAWGVKNIANQVENRPDQYLDSEAKQAAITSRQSLELRGGDYRDKIAEQSILRDADKRADYEDLDSNWRRAKSSFGAFLSGDFADSLTGRAANQGTAARRAAQRDLERQSDPLMDAIRGDAMNFRGTLSSMRSMGVYSRNNGNPGGPDSKETGFNALARHRAQYSAFDDGEIASAFQGVSGSGTRGAAYGLQGYAMHGTAAGIGGAAQNIGTMSKFGGGANFAAEMLRMAGGGGVDATTTGLLSSFIASQNDRLGMNTGAGPGQFQGQGLMEMISRGTAGPDGRLAAEQNMKGVDYLQRAVSGQTSGYQAARNYMIAGEAAPGISMYGQGFLASKMSMTELGDAAAGKGGDVSEIFKGLGGTKAQAASYLKGVSSSLLEGVSAQGLGDDTDAGALASALSESGLSPQEFFKTKAYEKYKGADGKIMTEAGAIRGYGSALSVTDDMDPAAAMGIARMAAGKSDKDPRKGGGMAGAASNPETEAAAQQMKTLAIQAAAATTALKEMTDAAKSNAEQANFQIKRAGTLTQDQQLKMNEYFIKNPKATAVDADKYLTELGMKANEAERQNAEVQQDMGEMYGASGGG